MISYEGLTKMHNLFTVEQTFSFFLILFYTIVKSITQSHYRLRSILVLMVFFCYQKYNKQFCEGFR